MRAHVLACARSPRSHPMCAALAAGALGMVAYLAVLLAGRGADQAGDLLYNTLIGLAAAICLARAISSPRERAAWLALGLGLAAWTAGDVYYTVVLADAEVLPAVAPSDGLFWAYSALSAVGVALMVRSRARGASAARWLDAGVCALAAASLGAAGIVQTVMAELEGDIAGQVAALTYPIADTLLLATVVAGLALAGWRPDRTLGLVALGLAVMTAADSLYLLQAAAGTYEDGVLNDALWPLSALLTAAAAALPAARRTPPDASRWLELPPALIGAAAVALLTYDHWRPVNGLALTLGVGALLAVVLRLAVVSRENLLARRRLEGLVAEQAALGRVARAVATGRGPEEVFALVAREAAALLDGGAAAVARFLPGEAIVVGSWSAGAPLGPAHLPLDGADPVTALIDALGPSATVAVPVEAGGALWGAVAVVRDDAAGPAPAAEARLAQFGELVATAIDSAQARDDLRARADELRRQAGVLRAVMDTVPEAVIMADESGRLLVSNGALGELAMGDAGRGATVLARLEALADRTLDPEGFRAALRAVAGDPECVRRDEYEIAESGRVLRRYTAPVRHTGPAGPVAGRIYVVAEVTDERVAERAKDRFIEIASHDLRTPLTSILGYLEMIEEEDAGPLSGEQRQFLEVIHRNAERLLRLAGDLLTVARADAGRLQLQAGPMDLGRVVSDCAESCRPLAGERGIALEVDAPEIAMIGDPQRLAEVVDNLVSNALKFTPLGGSVTLRAWAEDDRALMEVADTGMGIPAGELPNLFKRFYRTERAQAAAIPGTGLGLSISKLIVEAHGGTVAVASREGAGTRFRVELPVAEAAATAVEERRGFVT